jgi:hypothetical protein
MARGKSNKLKPFEKLLTVMVTGKPVTIEEIDATLGQEIHMYRLSTYIWHIKTHANGVVKAIKDGRKVAAYQLVNVDEVKEFLNRTGVSKSNFVPGQTTKIVRTKKNTTTPAKVVTLDDLKASPAESQVEEVTVVDEMQITEVKETA